GGGGRVPPGPGTQVRSLVEDPALGRVRPGLSGRDPARRPGAARMGRDPASGRMTVAKYLYGKLTAFGVVVALVTAVVDQAVKTWLIFGLDLAARQPIHLGPFIDLVLAWNTGISFSLFPQAGPLRQLALLALKAVAGGPPL